MRYYNITLILILIESCFIKFSIGKTVHKFKRQTNLGGCKITLPTDIPENEPVYLLKNNGNLTLYTPSGRENQFSVNSKIVLFCPGNRNILSTVNSNSTEVKCKSNLRFAIGTEEVAFNTLNCTRETTGSLKTTRIKCAGNKGSISQIGFELSRRQFIPLFEVCYNNKTASVIYTKHTINGKAIKYNVKEKERRVFKAIGISRASPTNSYKKNNQLTHFNNILGEQQRFINSTSFLSRGHFCPDADFIFTTGQFATYFYVNVAPQFQAVNGGNWLRVENMARNLSFEYNTEFTIYTGAFEQLTLPNNENQQTSLWLEEDRKISVPKWLYKVMINTETDSGIVMITLNNPFANRREIIEFCPNICNQVGLNTFHFQNLRKGYTFCCELNSFKSIVNDLPASATASNLLACSSLRF